MARRKWSAFAALAAILAASPYSMNLAGGPVVQERSACAQGGFCTQAGCIGGRDYCYQPPSGGMCYTTVPPQEN